MMESTLYDRLGGAFAIAAVVDHFSEAIVRNPLVGQTSENPDLREWHTNNLGRLPGLKFMHTHRVRMNLRPGSLPRLLVCHSRRSGFSDVWPTSGLRTIASLKWSTTAAMAKAPPSLSYKVDSIMPPSSCSWPRCHEASTALQPSVEKTSRSLLRPTARRG